MNKTIYPNSWEDETELGDSPPALWSSVIGLLFILLIGGFLIVRNLLTTRRREATEPRGSSLALDIKHTS